MAEKRKDSKGRVLRTGEAQREDGKYMFRYVDSNGERQTVYSWKLVETDRTPAGKKCKEALRTIEQRLLRDVEDGVNTRAANSTSPNSLFESFMDTRSDLKETTRCNYIHLYDKHVRDSIGKRKLSAISYSDVYNFYAELSRVKGLKISTIQSINSILWQLFDIAERDGLIRKNPSNGAMATLSKRLKEDQEKRNALTIEQQNALLDYVYSNEKYRRYGVLFTVLLGTGMRIGEALGLTWSNVDFKKNTIRVDHTLVYKDTESGGYKYRISDTKTKAGIRTIPMFSEVHKALLQARKLQMKTRASSFTVDGYSGFIFLNTAGKVYTPTFIYDVIQNIVYDFNQDEFILASKENRAPNYMPKISAHIFRHTFCTRLCENEHNLKIIQDVMGHKNIRTTMDVYNEATAQAKQHSFESLEGKIRLA